MARLDRRQRAAGGATTHELPAESGTQPRQSTVSAFTGARLRGDACARVRPACAQDNNEYQRKRREREAEEATEEDRQRRAKELQELREQSAAFEEELWARRARQVERDQARWARYEAAEKERKEKEEEEEEPPPPPLASRTHEMWPRCPNCAAWRKLRMSANVEHIFPTYLGSRRHEICCDS